MSEKPYYLVLLYCQVCKNDTYHIITTSHGLECLKCRSMRKDLVPTTQYPSQSQRHTPSV